MREGRPFYRTQTRRFYGQFAKKQIDLGLDEAEAYRRWHLLMAGVDESVIEAMSRDVNAEKTMEKAALTVRQLVKSHLGWQVNAKLAARTKDWYKQNLDSFVSVAAERRLSLPGGQKVAGSNPVGPIQLSQGASLLRVRLHVWRFESNTRNGSVVGKPQKLFYGLCCWCVAGWRPAQPALTTRLPEIGLYGAVSGYHLLISSLCLSSRPSDLVIC